MTNAKDELISFVERTGAQIKCVMIQYEEDYTKSLDENPTFILRVGHTEADLEEFLDKLDFEYDNGFGGQALFGTIWFTDGSWASRGEYDGSEWWQHHSLPEIPGELL